MHKNVTLTFIIFFLISVPLLAQNKKEIQKEAQKGFEELEDSELEYGEGKMRLWFTDAVNGMPIEGAAVKIDKIGSFITDSRGTITFPILDDGTYLISFRKNKYVPSDFTIEVDAGTLFDNNHFSVSPELDLHYVRIVLNWGKKPKDLDLHLVKEGVYHVSYHDMRTAIDGTAMLDRDDRNSYGPETITITIIDPQGYYRCFVHDYSNRKKKNSKKLAQSKAEVRVYAENRLLYTFKVSPGLIGNTWQVFEIQHGQIKPVQLVNK